MKAILEFDLDEPDDVFEHKRCVKASEMALAIWKFEQWTSRVYGGEEEKPEGKEMDEWIIDNWRDILSEHDINIEKLVM